MGGPDEISPGTPASSGSGEGAAGGAGRDRAAERAGRLRGTRRARLISIGAAVAAVIVALSVIGATIGSGRSAPHRLSQASAFTLRTLGHPGQHISLASYAGRPVIVNFFA